MADKGEQYRDARKPPVVGDIARLTDRNLVMAKCAQGEHSPQTKYGIVGIICAVVLFPFGFCCMW